MFKKVSLIMTCLFVIVLTWETPIQAQSSFNTENGQLQVEITESDSSFGDTKIVNRESHVPAGWVVIEFLMHTKIIKNMNGAPFGYTQITRIESPIPWDWVIIEIKEYTRVIKNITGAPLGHTEVISRESPFPSGWVVVSYEGETKTIKYIGS